MTDLVKQLHRGWAEDCLLKIPDNSVNVVLTSPPYADQRKGLYESIPPERYVEWFVPIAQQIKRILHPTGSFFLNIKPHIEDGEEHEYVDDLKKALRKEVGFKLIDTFAWVKQGYPGNLQGRFKNAWEPVFHFTKEKPTKITFNPLACGTPTKPETYARYLRKQHGAPEGGSGMNPINMRKAAKLELARPSNVVKVSVGNNQYSYQKDHPATFPEKFAEFFILSFSNPGDTILDPFAGSGTTGRVAWRNGRGFILIEKHDGHYDKLHAWAKDLSLQSNLFFK